jgi:hypothetical protein
MVKGKENCASRDGRHKGKGRIEVFVPWLFRVPAR